LYYNKYSSSFKALVNSRRLPVFSSGFTAVHLSRITIARMKAYIAISYSKRKTLQEAVDAIIAALHTFDITAFIFVDAFQFSAEQEQEMMQQAMAAIDSSDFLIAEATGKAIGVGIEAGYAVAKKKSVIYIRSKDAAHSTTLSGISSYGIIYEDSSDLKLQLEAVINTVIVTLQNK
jgi:2'-deoxynucleoside 5'-phosphate N-hydrolase